MSSIGDDPAALSRLSARFSLMDLLVFLVMPWRGDLSLMRDLSEEGA